MKSVHCAARTGSLNGFKLILVFKEFYNSCYSWLLGLFIRTKNIGMHQANLNIFIVAPCIL